MTILYIANCTRQAHDFHYRVPEVARIHQILIAPGSQAKIYKDAAPEVIDYIVNQHAMYGLVRVDEIDRTKPYIGMCYQLNKPVDVEAIMRALEHNDSVLVDQGYEIRKEAAVALASGLQQQAQENGTGLGDVTVSTTEEVKQGSNKADTVDETIKVSTKTPPTTYSRKQRGR